MSGTRKLEKFELEAFGVTPAARDSGTQKLEKFTPPPPPAERPSMSVLTPIAEISPLMLAQARSSVAEFACSTSGIVAREAQNQEAQADVAREAQDQEAQADAPPPPARSERTHNREPDVERLRTRLARKFTTLADEVTEAFAEFRVGAGAWSAELTAPEGMSTKGGKQALQHLRLRPTRQGYAVLVGGVVNAVGKTAELRDFDYMQALYHARFRRPLEISAGEWEQFLRKAEVVLRDREIAAQRVSAPRELAALPRLTAIAERNRRAAIATLAVVSLAAALVVWRVIVALWS